MGGIWSRGKRYWSSIDLHYAVEHDLATEVGELIKKGADVNIQNGEGKTPLILATIHQKYPMYGLVNCGWS